MTLYVFIVAVLTTFQASVSTDLTTTERNQGQHLGTSRVEEQVIQVTKVMFLIRARIIITKQGLMRGTIGSTHLIIITFNLHL